MLLAGLLAGCSQNDGAASGAAGMSEEQATLSARLPLKVEGIPLEAQIAITRAEQSRGLMYREALGENEGMLFPMKEPGPQSFWMKNVPIGLDIAYFDDVGALVQVHRARPHDLSPLPSRTDDIQFVLEMRRGWFAEKGLRPGAQLDLALVAEALAARGAEPAAYGLGKAEAE